MKYKKIILAQQGNTHQQQLSHTLIKYLIQYILLVI